MFQAKCPSKFGIKNFIQSKVSKSECVFIITRCIIVCVWVTMFVCALQGAQGAPRPSTWKFCMRYTLLPLQQIRLPPEPSTNYTALRESESNMGSALSHHYWKQGRTFRLDQGCCPYGPLTKSGLPCHCNVARVKKWYCWDGSSHYRCLYSNYYKFYWYSINLFVTITVSIDVCFCLFVFL